MIGRDMPRTKRIFVQETVMTIIVAWSFIVLPALIMVLIIHIGLNYGD